MATAPVAAEEQLTVAPETDLTTTPTQTAALVKGLSIDLAGLSQSVLTSRMEMPHRARVSHSLQPLRQVTLVGGDHFVAECLDWGSVNATFRRLDGQVIEIPVAAVASLVNPPGEIDLIDESFEAESSNDSNVNKSVDKTHSVEGQCSLLIDSSSSEYRREFAPSLTSARIEFSFQVGANDPLSGCGEWRLEWNNDLVKRPPVIIRVGADRRIVATGISSGGDSTSQILKISESWHSFVAIVTPDRTRLIIDDAILASFPTPNTSIQAIQFRHARPESKNRLWIDALHVSAIDPTIANEVSNVVLDDGDMICLATGDQLFGQLRGVGRTQVTTEAFDETRMIPWNQLIGLDWRRPAMQVVQAVPAKAGIVSRIEMQPFDDRPDCEPERWTATVLKVDSTHVIAQHSLAGELTFRWSEIRRIEPLFFGRTILIDARRFHLGNSIRSDFHRHLPDGTELGEVFRLKEIPIGKPFLSLDVAELEAASPDAPPASPFLAELRAGQLVTEVFINDRRIGELNSLTRFKVTIQKSERVRIEIPSELLKTGENSFRFRQRPLKNAGNEFDDCEVGNLRLEFEIR